MLYAIRNGGFSGAIMPAEHRGRARTPTTSRSSWPSTRAAGRSASPQATSAPNGRRTWPAPPCSTCRLIRRDPEPCARRWPAAAPTPRRARRACSRSTRAGASAAAAEERCAPSRTRPRRRSRAAKRSGEDADEAIARMQDVAARRSRRCGESAREAEERAAGGARPRCRTCPTRPPRREDEVLREVGDGRARPARDHLELAGERDRHGARRAAVAARASPTCAATW